MSDSRRSLASAGFSPLHSRHAGQYVWLPACTPWPQSHSCCCPSLLPRPVSRNQTAQKAQSQFCSDGTLNRKCKKKKKKKEDFSHADPRSNRTDWSLVNTSTYPYKRDDLADIDLNVGLSPPNTEELCGHWFDTHTDTHTHTASLKLKGPLNADIYNTHLRNQWATVYLTCDMYWWAQSSALSQMISVLRGCHARIKGSKHNVDLYCTTVILRRPICSFGNHFKQ